MVHARRFTFHLAFLLAVLAPHALAAELWRSALAAKSFYLIDKTVLEPESEDGGTPTSFAPLPPAVVAAAGSQAVDYESFLATYVSPTDQAALELALKGTDLIYATAQERKIQLPQRAFDPLDVKDRVAPEFPLSFAPQAIPGLFVVQFAYPPRDEWYSQLKGCGAEVVATFQSYAALFKAPALTTLTLCPAAGFLLWIDSYLTTDRISPDMLAEGSALGYSFQFKPTTDLGVKAAAMPPSTVVSEAFADPEMNSSFMSAELTLADFTSFVATDPDLLSVTYRGEASFSDERQGQIVAGNYTPQGTVVSPGYAAWLACPPKPAGTPCKSLLDPTNQQLVTILDSGYADAATPNGAIDHHPDLESLEQILNPTQPLPDRLVEIRNFSNSSGTRDVLSHGSIVAGIIAGAGRPEFSDPLQPGGLVVKGGGKDRDDALGFFHGSGIAPSSTLLVARLADDALIDTKPAGKHEAALAWARLNTSDGTDRSLLINESWNLTRNVPATGTPTDVVAVNSYDQSAQFYDARVRDAVVANPLDKRPMTIVFSAGNQAWDRAANSGLGGVRFDSVGSPGTAKNVITVGASASYRPGPTNPPLDCRDNTARFLSDDARHISTIGRFSGRARLFSAAGATKLHQVRIKPDLVAPAIRVFSTVPFYPSRFGDGPGCAQYFPDPTTSGYYYTYATGTSFAAPVVTGVAAYARKWFLDQTPSLNPTPSMIKAALIANADNLGNQGGNGQDHRPSPSYGWGRVNLGKLVDGRIARFYVEPARTVNMTTGSGISYDVTIVDPTRETVFTMSWLDLPSDLVGNSQAALKNDLQLKVEELGVTPLKFWMGNNFNENIAGNDNGTSFRFSAGGAIADDKINTVEVIVIPAGLLPAGRRFRITVTAKSLAPNARQSFSIYATNVRLGL